MDDPSLTPIIISTATSLVAVVVSAILAWINIIQVRVQDSTRRSQEFLSQLMPRRLESFEVAWQTMFEIQISGSLSPDQQEQLVRASLWLPAELKQKILKIAGKPDLLLAQDASEIRSLIEMHSGSALAEKLQSETLPANYRTEPS